MFKGCVNFWVTPPQLVTSGSWDITYLICYVTLQDHMIKLFIICNRHAKFGDRGHYGSGDLTYLTCHMTFENHVTKGSCDFMKGNSSLYITILPDLAAISIMVV